MLQPICGYVMDTIGLKLGFAIFATAWSFICMGHGLAGNWQTLFGLRTLLGICRGLGESGGDEGDLGMVSGERAWPCRRVLQHGCVARVDARGTARRVGDSDAQLAVRLRPYRSDWPRLGRALAGVVSAAGEASIVVGRGTRLHRRWSGSASRRRRASGDYNAFSGSATSGASRFRVSSPIRRGAR